MNRQFPVSYEVISDTEDHIAESNPWYGILLHDDTVIESITIAEQEQITDQPTILLLIKNISPGTAFLMEIKQIKLSAGGCKLINPN